MLKELKITNFALIDYLSISFNPGLNIITGETGAGKTILVNALNLLLGGRASADYIRSGADSAEVEASFNCEKGHPIYQNLESAGYPCSHEDDIIIRRVLFRSEKVNRNYLNGHLVPLSLLITIGAWLVDIHGQHEHQLLLNPNHHIEILDRFAALEADTEEVSQAYHAYQGVKEKLSEAIKKKENLQKEYELMGFQRQEIDQLSLFPGEEEELIKQQTILTHAAHIQELVFTIENSLYQSEGSVHEVMSEVQGKIAELSLLDQEFSPLEEIINTLLIQIDDMAHQLRNYSTKTDFSPQHLEEIEERIDRIERLKKKYRLSFDGILKYRDEIEKRLQFLDDYEDKIALYSNEKKQRWTELKEKAARLSEKRRIGAKKIERGLEMQLRALKMEKAKFIVLFSTPPSFIDDPQNILTAKGWDAIEFLFSANLGEDPKPLAKIASGGEISRVMLALKSSLAQADQVLTLIFDEIDTGIGGQTAITVGKKMKELAQRCQIICITHMPQIASQATTHYLVSKKVEKGRTTTVVNRLSLTEQVEELAKMITGDTRSEIALYHAREMLNNKEDIQ